METASSQREPFSREASSCESFPYMRGEIALSRQARSLWGKSDGGEGACWLPLYMHMLDSAGVAEHLWDEWLPQGTRSFLARPVGGDLCLAQKLACFIAGVHDIGKATPSFQGMPCGKDRLMLDYRPRNVGLTFCAEVTGHRRVPHPRGSYLVLFDILTRDYGWQAHCARAVAAVVGGHHGKPPEIMNVNVPNKIREEAMPQVYGLGWDEGSACGWTSVQAELVSLVAQAVGLAQGELDALGSAFVPAPAESLLTGFVIMADWLASDQNLFPLVANGCDDEGVDESRLRVQPSTWEDVARQVRGAWRRAGLIPAWRESPAPSLPVGDFYRERFGFSERMQPRPVQRAAVEVARSAETPGLVIVEAPMGEGKTEAALAAAEILAVRTGRGGVCIALPTMATTDAMFGRVHRWLARLPCDGARDARSVYLAHGKARLNEEFQGLMRSGGRWSQSTMGEDLRDDAPTPRASTSRAPALHGKLDPSDSIVVSQWMQGRKKGMLANFVVCTVDQVLMAALEMKHLSLRQLALANKVVIIDECHAYDAYMRCYLNRALGWLGSMGVPVVLLSATLPARQRHEMLDSYRRGQCAVEAPKTIPVRRGSWRYAKRSAPAVPALDGNPESLVGPPAQGAGDLPKETNAYPLITYTDGDKDACSVAPEPSGRSLDVRVELVGDDDETLVKLLGRLLGEGGCAGVICTTVTRAQQAARVLRDAFGGDTVVLTHARFADFDRMVNETRLRDLLGLGSTRENGCRPERMIVVGTQVLEQSLDIDFDVMVSDVAPVDLVMQRLGRLHRHLRQRPVGLEEAACYIRGIKDWEDEGPVFADGVGRVYPAATLLESLGSLGLTGEAQTCAVSLPVDIARTVRVAYGDKVVLPQPWRERYKEELGKRNDEAKRKQGRADACLLKDAAEMVRDGKTLLGWYTPKDAPARDREYGPRAVRDTTETVEVLAVELRGAEVHLLPWIGDEASGVELGAQVDTAWAPDDATAQLAAQSAVRLPQSLCRPDRIEGLINELEQACGPYVGSWQESPWLAGCLPLLLRRDERGRLCATVCGWAVTYSREEGLVVERGEAMMEALPSKAATCACSWDDPW